MFENHHPVFGALEKAEPRSANHGISVSVGLLGSCWLGVSWTKSRCLMKFDPFLVQAATIGLRFGARLVTVASRAVRDPQKSCANAGTA